MQTRPSGRSGHRSRRVLAPVVVLLAAVTMFVGNPVDAGAAQITSAGPLTVIDTTPDLNCAVNHVDDSHGEFYGDTGCGTFVTDGTNLYGPASVPAGSGATGVTGYHAWTPVSQNGPTGAGTAADPYKLVTVVKGGPFTVTQTDSYIAGQESFRTDVKVESSGNVTATVYRAADCYLQGSDSGLGRLDGGIAPTCVAGPDSDDPDRIEQWYPLTSGSNYIVDTFGAVWSAVGSMQPLPDTVLPNAGSEGSTYDNAAGLSWTAALSAGAARTFSSIITFSPTGLTPLVVSKTANVDTVEAGGQVTYTITIANPGGIAQTITEITDMLPDGFGYVMGSTTGVTTDDPFLDCLPLIWSGEFTVPAGTEDEPGTVTLTFVTQAPTTPGTYTNTATASGADGVNVIDATDTAPVTVTEAAAATTTTTIAGTDDGDDTTTTTVAEPGDDTTTTTTTTVPEEEPDEGPAHVEGEVVVPPAECPADVTPPTTPGGSPGNGGPSGGHAAPATPVSAQPAFTG